MKKIKKKRLDTLLIDCGLCGDADEALRLILAHKVKVGDAFAKSPADMVAPDAHLQVVGRKRFVSRGGDKLQGALDAFDVVVEGANCLDIGSSTGGFSDCLLQAGAARVACVDVNYGQLAWEVRCNPKVSVFERTNIKSANSSELGAPFDIIVIDVSFIGLASLADTFPRFCYSQPNLHDGKKTDLVALIKPQFEAHADEVQRGGTVSADTRARTVEEVTQALLDVGFFIHGVIESPVTGSKSHNVEYLIWATFDPPA
jgi:23S rRNA (cytidine1920-2'-O)/16S rRNA (cytidine1409-2'-O)-methyltransferase